MVGPYLSHVLALGLDLDLDHCSQRKDLSLFSPEEELENTNSVASRSSAAHRRGGLICNVDIKVEWAESPMLSMPGVEEQLLELNKGADDISGCADPVFVHSQARPSLRSIAQSGKTAKVRMKA